MDWLACSAVIWAATGRGTACKGIQTARNIAMMRGQAVERDRLHFVGFMGPFPVSGSDEFLNRSVIAWLDLNMIPGTTML